VRVPATGSVTEADLEIVEVTMTDIKTDTVVPPAPVIVVHV
jgi:hypothetical protein